MSTQIASTEWGHLCGEITDQRSFSASIHRESPTQQADPTQPAPSTRSTRGSTTLFDSGGSTSTVTCTAARHNTLTAYWNSNCRCPRACQLAGRRQKEYRTGRRRLLPAIGTTRRVQALASIGWRCSDLAARLGVTHEAVAQLARGRTLVREGTAERVAGLYSELCDTPGPSLDVARRSAAKGWLPPKWWDADTIDDPSYEPPTEATVHWSDVDPVAVERAISGDRLKLTRAERITAVRRMRAGGASLNQIAKRLRVEQRQVTRDLDEQLDVAS